MASNAGEATPEKAAWTYWEWQQALAAVLLQPRPRTAPFVLFVDDTELTRQWPEHLAPAESLCTAVNAALDWTAGSGLFRKVSEIDRLHRRGNAPPLTLPLLAVTVLAATRMRQDSSFTANAYFARLAQTLRPDASGSHLIELRDQLSQGFGVVAQLWRDLHEWVEVAGTFGTSTIRDHPHYTRIGYPLSQALLRHSDRMRLTRFFAALELQERGLPPLGPFRTYLRVWTSRPRGLSEAFVSALSDKALTAIIVDQVYSLAEAWDGVVLNPGGKRRLDLRLVFDLDEFNCRWAATVIPGVTEDDLTAPDGRVVEIRLPEWGSLYSVSGAPAPAEWLGKRVKLTGSACSAVVDIPDVFVAREDADAGGWVSTDGLEPYEEHLLVVAPEHRAAVEALLHRAADPGWTLIPQRPPHVLLPSRAIFRSVRLSNPSAFEHAVRELGVGIRHSLRPDAPPRPRLVNGLRIAKNLGHNHYLAGGEPDLLLPVGDEARHVPTSLDGHEQRPPFLATGFPIELRRYGPLPEGQHVLMADGEPLVFHVHKGLQTEPAGSVAGWKLGAGAAQLSVSADADVSGALLKARVPEPRLLRRVREFYIASRTGHIRRLNAPDPSAWVAGHTLPPSQYWEFFPEADDAWLIEYHRGALQKPTLLRWQEPAIRRLNDESRRVWSEIAAQFLRTEHLLDLYLKAAIKA